MRNLAHSAPTAPSNFRFRAAVVALAATAAVATAAGGGASVAQASGPVGLRDTNAGPGPIKRQLGYARRANVSGHAKRHPKSAPVAFTPHAAPAPVYTPPAPVKSPTAPPADVNPTSTPIPKPTPAPNPAPTPTPTPAPTPATPSTSPGVLFSGVHLRDFANLQEAPNAITEVADPLGSGETVLKMTVSDKDVAPITPTENPRAQALSPDLIHPGEEFWLATKFMIPQDFPASVPGWMSLVSIYGAPFNGSSPWQIGIEGSKLSWMRNGDYKYDVPWETTIPRGQWTTVLLHERFATDGWVEMWIDGAPIKFFSPGTYNPSHLAQTEHLAMKTMDSSNNGGANAAKIMQYRKVGMFSTATVYFGALKLGTTRASVGG